VCVCVCVDDQQSFIAISQQVNTRAWFRLNLHTHNQPVWWNIWRKTVCVCVCVCVCVFLYSGRAANELQTTEEKISIFFFGLFAAWAARSSDAIAVTSSRDCCSLLPGYYPMVITYGYYSEWTYTHDHSDPCCSFVFNCNCVLFYKIKALEM